MMPLRSPGLALVLGLLGASLQACSCGPQPHASPGLGPVDLGASGGVLYQEVLTEKWEGRRAVEARQRATQYPSGPLRERT
jgi:hypothetical protein